MEALLSAENVIAPATLASLVIVLGIEKFVFIAIEMAKSFSVMMAAVVIAVGVMTVFAESVRRRNAMNLGASPT